MRTLLLPVFLLAIFGCSSTRFTPEKLPARQIRWGEGGGFTGLAPIHILLENGQTFRRERPTDLPREEKKLKKKTAKSLFDAAEALRNTPAFEHPGNRYFFLEFATDSVHVTRYSWGEKGFAVPTPVQALYNRLQTETAKAKQ